MCLSLPLTLSSPSWLQPPPNNKDQAHPEEKVEENDFALMKIHTKENGSDMLTKVLLAEKIGACQIDEAPHVRVKGSLLGNRSLRMGSWHQLEWTNKEEQIRMKTNMG